MKHPRPSRQGYQFPNLLALIQHLFTDQFIYSNTDMLESLTDNPKGFIQIRKLLQLPSIKYMISQTQFLVSVEQISRVIKQESKLLICNNFRVRRTKKFENKYKRGQIFPTFIQNFEREVREEEMRGYLEQFTIIYDIYFKAENRWCFVFTENPNAILTGIAQYQQANLHSKIKAYKVKQSIDIYKTSLRLFNKHIFDQLSLNKEQNMNIQSIRHLNTNVSSNGGNITQNMHRPKRYHKEMIEVFEWESKKRELQSRKIFLQKIQELRNFDNRIFYEQTVLNERFMRMQSQDMIEEEVDDSGISSPKNF